MSEKQNFNCSKCSKFFSVKRNLTRHEKEVHGRNEGPSVSWKCNVCEASFTRNDKLVIHKQRKHVLLETKEKQSISGSWECTVCEASFTGKDKLLKHKQRNHALLGNEEKKSCTDHVKSLPGFDKLISVLPDGYLYEYLSLSLKKNGFLAKFEIPEFMDHQINEWLIAFQNKNFVTLRLLKSDKSSKTLQSKKYRCHHNTLSKTKSKRLSKNTQCPALLRLYLRKTPRDTTKLVVVLQHTHNHPLRAAAMLRFRDPSSDVKEKFIKMFRSGHSPSKSLEIHKQHLRLEYGDDYFLVAGDRKHCPDLQWVFRLYYKVFKRKEERVRVISGENEGEGAPGNVELCSSDSNKETHRSAITELKITLGKIFDTMEAKPEAFSGAATAAVRSLSRINTEAGLISVFHNIGKCSFKSKPSGLRKRPVQEYSGRPP